MSDKLQLVVFLFSQLSHVCDQRICLFVSDLFTEPGHVSANIPSIHDGVENTFVANFVLPLTVSDVAGVTIFTFLCLCPPIKTMTLCTVLFEKLRCRSLVVFFVIRCDAAISDPGDGREADGHCQAKQQGQQKDFHSMKGLHVEGEF